MKKILSVVFFSLVLGTLTAQQVDLRLAGVDTMVNRIMKAWKVPGVSIAIVEKNKVLLSKGFGVKDVAQQQPVTENTLFAIGSCTKSFTAALLGTELASGQLDLDAPARNYLPDLRFYSDELTTCVSIRDMLTHRTGLPRHDYAWYSGAVTSRDSLVHMIRYLEPSAPIRRDFQYNNLMYVTVAHMLEKINGKSWEAQVRERLFMPLGMTSSTTGEIPASGDYAYGYALKNGSAVKLIFLTNDLAGIAPAGGIVSSAKDMAKWLLMWTNQGKLDGKEIISSVLYNQAISSQMVVNANLPTKYTPDNYFFNYGLGWYISNYRGHYGLGHGGNINGFSSFMLFLPADSIGVYVAVNMNNSQAPRALASIILDKMIKAPYRDWSMLLKASAAAGETAVQQSDKQAPPTHLINNYSGKYTHPGYGLMTIREEKDTLTATFNRWKLRVLHLHHNYFRFVPITDALEASTGFDGEFSVDPDGGIGSLKVAFEDEIAPIAFVKQASSNVDVSSLEKYCGNYDFNGMVAKIYLSGTVLKAAVPGQPEYELINAKDDEFSLKGVKGVTIRFERDKDGNVLACQFIQPNGTFKLKKLK
ncbi:MAG: serine hydrolase [Chitinophagaceae bacterium]